MSKKRIILVFCLLAFLVLVKMIFTPVPQAIPKNCKVVTGIVEKVFSPCCMDVNFKLKDDPHRYYINRGLDNNEVDMVYLTSVLIGQKVNFQVIKRNWTPLDPQHRLMPVAAIEHSNEVVFSRMK